VYFIVIAKAEIIKGAGEQPSLQKMLDTSVNLSYYLPQTKRLFWKAQWDERRET
jgi:hypothetical protein